MCMTMRKFQGVHLFYKNMSDLTMQTDLTSVTYRFDRSSLNWSDRHDTSLTGWSDWFES
jgi:hypothetical protein